MANPQTENGYVKIANEIWDALTKIRISGEEWQVLNVIIRKTWGWNKKEDAISLSQFVDFTGLKKPHIVRAREKLLSKKVISITKNGNGSIVSYCINKDYEKWEPLPKKVIVTKNGNASLPKMVPTKDTTTKDNISIVPYQKIVDLYHEVLPQLSRVVKLSKKRQSMVKARWFESNKTKDLNWWKGYFEMIKDRPFLLGDNDRGWKADFEFLMTESKFLAILEGKYR